MHLIRVKKRGSEGGSYVLMGLSLGSFALKKMKHTSRTDTRPHSYISLLPRGQIESCKPSCAMNYMFA